MKRIPLLVRKSSEITLIIIIIVAVLCDDNPNFDVPSFSQKVQPFMTHPEIVLHMPTGEAQPIKVKPKRAPMHYKNNIQKQITRMLQQGIIQKSSQ